MSQGNKTLPQMPRLLDVNDMSRLNFQGRLEKLSSPCAYSFGSCHTWTIALLPLAISSCQLGILEVYRGMMKILAF